MVIYRSREYSYQNRFAAVTLGLCLVAAVVSLAVSGAWREIPVGSVIIVALLAALLFTPLTITVDDAGASALESDAVVRVNLAGLGRRTIPLPEIAGVERRKYSPLREFGGWGWRNAWSRRAAAYATRGTSAVVLSLRDGSEVYLGVADEQGLIDALQVRIHP